MIRYSFFTLLSIILLFIQGCNGSSTTTPYNLKLPSHFPAYVEPINNQTTVEGVALGRRLYYDPMLSLGGPLEGKACATCHLQENSFSNNAEGVSVPPHTNLNWASFYLWNGAKSGSLEEVMEFEILDFFKANISLFTADPVYRQMNYAAFEREDVTATDMANAMAQWMRTLVSYRSKYDRYLAGEVDLTDQEKIGEEIFNGLAGGGGGDCFKCHVTPLTTDHDFHNNGLEEFPAGNDLGRFNVTGDPLDVGRFKIPTLRNIELTAPYMHDGRFQTLEEVVEHYDHQVVFSDTLDAIMVTPDKIYSLKLHTTEKAALVAFLKTFTDQEFVTDPELSSPFE